MQSKRQQDPRSITELAIDVHNINRKPVGHAQNERAHTRTSNSQGRTVSVNIGESPLSWLYAHKHLTERQFLAGEKLRSDYERASLGPNITMSWNSAPPTKGRRAAPGHMDASESSVHAKQGFDAALSVLGQGLDDVAWRVICNCESVSSAEKALGWPTRSGKLVLKLALDRLASHYHIR